MFAAEGHKKGLWWYGALVEDILKGKYAYLKSNSFFFMFYFEINELWTARRTEWIEFSLFLFIFDLLSF